MNSKFEIQTQQKLNWCWAAVAATVSNYFFPNQAVQQCQIAKNILGIDCCTDPDPEACDAQAELQTALAAIPKLVGNSLNVNTLQNEPLSFDAVRKQIDAGLPVCARIQWFGENRSHFVIISGYSISQSNVPWVDISDPYYEDSTIPYQHFVSAYLDAGTWRETYLVAQK